MNLKELKMKFMKVNVLKRLFRVFIRFNEEQEKLWDGKVKVILMKICMFKIFAVF